MSTFTPPTWAKSPHLQTVWQRFFRPMPNLHLRWETITLPDDDFLELAWDGDAQGDGPIVILLHGLEGSVYSKYAAGMMQTLSKLGFRPVVMHFRGCSGKPNRAERTYHSGETTDFDHVLKTLINREPDQKFAAIGYSLGGNVLLKWLGEQGAQAPLHAASAVSVPFMLGPCSERLTNGISHFYQNSLMRDMRETYMRKFGNGPSPLGQVEPQNLRTFHEFDDAITAPLHGFINAEDYYAKASSRPFLQSIRKPTLIVHSLDDPFMYPSVAPDPKQLPESVEIDLNEYGGHVGFVYGKHPLAPRYWLEERIPSWLLQRFGMAADKARNSDENPNFAINQS